MKDLAGGTDGLDELRDSRASVSLGEIDLLRLKSSTAVQAMLTSALLLAILIWPDLDNRVLSRLLGLVIVVSIGGSVWNSRRHSDEESESLKLGASAASALIGVLLITSPPAAKRVLAFGVGAAIALMALRRLVSRRHRASKGSYLIVLLELALAAVLLVFPAQTVSAITSGIAATGFGLSLLVIALVLTSSNSSAGELGASRLIEEWLLERPKSVNARGQLYDKILFEGSDTRRRVVRFFILMGFASAISSMGVLTDSTAVVIGAMLIAPLMTPLMGMAISLVMGWPNRMLTSALVAIGGIILSISIAALIGLIVPVAIDTTTNTQILARSTPTLLDLVTALAAGAAGAYGLSRPDVSDSLPGVAIAISLVPPLSVVGISYSQGDWAAGSGSLLLFATNMMAILIMGGVTFVVTGVTPVTLVAENQHRVRTWIGSLAFVALLVLGGLFLNGTTAASNLLRSSTVNGDVSEWLAGTPEYRVVSTDTVGDRVTITVVGPSDGLPPVASLAGALSESFGREMTADVRLVIEERIVETGGG